VTIIETPELSERAKARAARRQAREERTGALRAWREKAAQAAKERVAKRRKELLDQPRGVDRVPARYRDLAPTVEEETPELGVYRGYEAAYADRRRAGQRGHQRPARRRELPGAIDRRVERNRKAWLEGEA